jgi:hypothetical protein
MNELRSNEIHINTEGLYYDSAGNQLDAFRVNLNESPFSVGDNERLRIRPTTALVMKNWNDINESNRYFRVSCPNPDANFVAYDLVFGITKTDYATHESYANAFCSALQTLLEGCRLTANETIVVSYTGGSNFVATSTDGVGDLEPTAAGDDFVPRLSFTISISGGGSVAFTDSQIPMIQALQLDGSQDYTIFGRTGGVGGNVASRTLTRNEYLSDSYIIAGCKRLRTFTEFTSGSGGFNIDATSWTKPTIGGSSNKTFTFAAPWRMNYALNTLPYLYVRCQSTLNQGTTNYNLTDGVNQSKSIVHNDIIAKLRRTYSRENLGIITYELHQGASFYSYIATRQLSNIVFSVVDKFGRHMDYVDYSDIPFNAKQNVEGNLMIDMSLKVEIDKKEIAPPMSGEADKPRTYIMNVGGPDAPSDLPVLSPQLNFTM